MKVKDLLGEHSPLSEEWTIVVTNHDGEELYFVSPNTIEEIVPLKDLLHLEIDTIEPSMFNKSWMTIYLKKQI